MTIVLASSFIPYQTKEEYKPMPLIADNGFVERLKKVWKDNIHFLIFASNPAQTDEERDYVMMEMQNAFELSGLPIREMKVFDYKSQETLKDLVTWADIIYLAGGHAPTENKFMKECHLKDALEGFEGVLMGLSAGAANCAEDVYVFPELEHEMKDKIFVKTSEGLGFTKMQIMPHGQYYENLELYGINIMEDIILPDSYGRKIYFIPDGSYFWIEDRITEFFGEGYVIENGEKRELRSGAIMQEAPLESVAVLETIVSENFELVFAINKENGRVYYLRTGETFDQYGINIGELHSHELLTKKISEKLVVLEEKEAFLDQIRLSYVIDEIETKKEYVRTVHFITNEKKLSKAEGIRIKPLGLDSDYLLATMQDIEAIIDHDWMTDELARNGFLRDASEYLEDKDLSEGYCLVYSNIKGFKAVNDLFGQESGDMVIFEERDTIKKLFNPLVLGRLESEHFVFVCKEEVLTYDNFARLMQRKYAKDYKQYRYDIRLGIFRINDLRLSIDEMIDRAKLAEKSLSENAQVNFNYHSEKMHRDYVNENILLSDMKEAIKKHQFEVYYQPVVDAQTGKICSAEALVRWNHPQRGLLTPGHFVQIFEKEGVISRLDKFIFNEVYRFSNDCLKRIDRVVPVAINLSRVDFFDPNLVTMMIDTIKEKNTGKSPINVEVTESAYAILEQNALEALYSMKDCGMKILLDDYGSGMSSLSTLESFGFDIVKLDMGFIRKIGKSRTAEAIIESTVQLAHAIGSKVTAEGVETQEQLDFLKNIGCDMIQGYYYYKPMREEEFLEILKLESGT